MKRYDILFNRSLMKGGSGNKKTVVERNMFLRKCLCETDGGGVSFAKKGRIPFCGRRVRAELLPHVLTIINTLILCSKD